MHHRHPCDLCSSFHVVEPDQNESTLYPVPECYGNPGRFNCPTCKGFKQWGICSHVLAINHILELFNVKFAMLPIAKRKAREGRPRKPPPALVRMPLPQEDDHGDEEDVFEGDEEDADASDGHSSEGASSEIEWPASSDIEWPLDD